MVSNLISIYYLWFVIHNEDYFEYVDIINMCYVLCCILFRAASRQPIKIQTSQILKTALFWAIMLRVAVITYRRFGATYRSHIFPSFFWILDR
jgi:hypothetical protein